MAAEYTCLTHAQSAQKVLDFNRQVQSNMSTGAINIDSATRIVRAKLVELRDMTSLWVPGCDDQGFYLRVRSSEENS